MQRVGLTPIDCQRCRIEALTEHLTAEQRVVAVRLVGRAPEKISVELLQIEQIFDVKTRFALSHLWLCAFS